MSDLIVPNIICFQTQRQLATLSSTGILLKGVLIDLRAHNFVHAKTSLRVRCVHARNRARNLSSPANEMTRILTNTLMNIFKNSIPHKTKKFDSKHPEWMNSVIISSLKKRTKYTEGFYKNPSDYNKDLLNNQPNECTRLIIQTKEKHIPKMSGKLDNPNTAHIGPS